MPRTSASGETRPQLALPRVIANSQGEQYSQVKTGMVGAAGLDVEFRARQFAGRREATVSRIA